MDFPKIFWGASIDEIKQGYVYNKENKVFTCLCCGEVFEQGLIYQDEDKLFDAEYAVKNHIKNKHQSVLHFLLTLDKKYTSLTDVQKNLIIQFYEGKNDKEIAKELEVSSSTIRNQRFQLREKSKQAKIILSIVELLEDKMSNYNDNKLIPIHRTATSVDERYAITENEKKEFINKYFANDVLISFPKRQKRIIAILQHIITFFDYKRKYTEKEVNEILGKIYHDYVTIRRYLIEYGLLKRKADGSEYWVNL